MIGSPDGEGVDRVPEATEFHDLVEHECARAARQLAGQISEMHDNPGVP
jgi:hypothetical protein